MNLAGGIGRAVMQDKQRFALADFQNALVKAGFLPGVELLGLILRQTRLHGKVRLRQIQCLFEF
jgi:hypothetical protein